MSLRLPIIIGVMLLAPVSSRGDSNCLSQALRTLGDKLMDAPNPYDVSELTRKVNAISFMSRWQKNLLIELWKVEAAAGLRPVNLDQGPFMRSFYPAYVLKRVPDIFLSAFRAKGIKGAKRFLLIPMKTVATIAVEQPVSHGALIFALSAQGAVLGYFSFNYVDDLVTNSDPHDLKDNEVNIIVKMDSTKVREDGNAASFNDGKVVDKIKTAAPNKTVVIDLSAEANDGRSGADKIAEVSESLQASGKQIRKIFVTGHGMPGEVYGDATGVTPQIIAA
jgi:hypothetical protein